MNVFENMANYLMNLSPEKRSELENVFGHLIHNIAMATADQQADRVRRIIKKQLDDEKKGANIVSFDFYRYYNQKLS